MNNTVTYVVDYKSLAVLPFIVFLVVFIISLIRLKVKKKKPMNIFPCWSILHWPAG